MVEFLLKPWPWWFSGLLVGLTVPLMFLLTGKAFGISTSFQQIGSMCAPGCNASYLRDHDRRAWMWTITFVAGIALGGWIGTHWLSASPVEFLPPWHHDAAGVIRLLVGGFLVGFGARYAGGCTSGHSITGIAHFNWVSLLATCCFFAGGLTVTWGLGRWIFGQG